MGSSTDDGARAEANADVDVSSLQVCWSDCNSTSTCEGFLAGECGLSCGSFSSGLLHAYCDVTSSSSTGTSTYSDDSNVNCYDDCSFDCNLWFSGSCGQSCDDSTASYINKYCYFFGGSTDYMFPANVTSYDVDYSAIVSYKGDGAEEEEEEKEEEEEEEEDDDDENDVDGYSVDDHYKKANGNDDSVLQSSNGPTSIPTFSPSGNATAPPDSDQKSAGSMIVGIVMSTFFVVGIFGAILLNNICVKMAKEQEIEQKRLSDVKALVAGDDQELMEVGGNGRDKGGGLVRNPVYFDGFTIVSADDADAKQ